MRNIAVKIMYDGTDFHGWQYQPNGITIQEVVEHTLTKLLNEDIKVVGCSRTDAGVHAMEYYFNFLSETKIPCEKLAFAFNNHLRTPYISAICAYDVPLDFNSRFSSVGKRYVYKIHNSKTPNPFTDRFSWFFPYKVDINKMNEAAAHFIGEHDFSGFMSAGGSQKTTIRTITNCSVEKNPEWDSDILITVEANAFLYNMVRIISGTLCEVGTGRISPDDIPLIIKSCDRKNSGMTAPPEGLHLSKVFYPDELFL